MTGGRAASRSGAPALIGALSLVAFVALGFAVAPTSPPRIDLDVRAWAMGAFAAGPLRAAVEALNVAGSLEVGAVLTGVLAAVFAVRRRWVGAAAILSTWLVELVATAAKVLLMRPRPPGAVVTSLLGETWSYPSGHVVRAMAVIGVLVWLAQRNGRSPLGGGASVAASGAARAGSRLVVVGAALIAGLVMGVARVAVGAHWPTDVLGGLLLSSGFVCLLFVFEGYAARSVRRPPSGARPGRPTRGPDGAGP